MYELAYCDDGVSVIRHIVYTVRPLLFRRHHRHCPAFLSLHSFVVHNAPRHSQRSLTSSSLPFEFHLLSIFETQFDWVASKLFVLNVDGTASLPSEKKFQQFPMFVCYLLGALCMVHYWCNPAHMSGAQLVVCSCTIAPGATIS